MSIPSIKLKFKFMKNDQNVYVLTAPAIPTPSLGNTSKKLSPFNSKPNFGNTRFFTVPYQSPERGDQKISVLFGYARKHDGDLAQIACAPRERNVELKTMTVSDAKQVAAALCLPLLVMLGDDEVDSGLSNAYFHDPAQKKPNEDILQDWDV